MQNIQMLIKQLLQTDGSDQIYAEILNAIRTQDILWTAFSPVTRNYYTGMEHGEYAAYLFSEKAFADKFQEDMLQKNIDITIAENKAPHRMLLLGDLMRTGVTALFIDSGQQLIAVSLVEMLDELEGHGPEHAQRIVMNPHLLAKAHYFYQQVSCRRADTQDELAMLQELYKASYITPIQMQEGGPVLPMLRKEDGTRLMMFFTDWPELRRYDKNQQCEYKKVGFHDMKVLIENVDGIVVNPFGVNIVLDQEMLHAVEQASNGTLQLPARKITMDGDTQIRITAVNEDAQELMDAAAELLKENQKVNAAYLRMIVKDNEPRPSYLMVLDASCPLKELYRAIADKTIPLAKGMDIEFVSYQEDFGRSVAEKTKPFYKKRRFRLFG